MIHHAQHCFGVPSIEADQSEAGRVTLQQHASVVKHPHVHVGRHRLFDLSEGMSLLSLPIRRKTAQGGRSHSKKCNNFAPTQRGIGSLQPSQTWSLSLSIPSRCTAALFLCVGFKHRNTLIRCVDSRQCVVNDSTHLHCAHRYMLGPGRLVTRFTKSSGYFVCQRFNA